MSKPQPSTSHPQSNPPKKPQRMYAQIIHDIPSSPESSDIRVGQDSRFARSFENAEQELSNVSLFSDLPLNLLDEPRNQGEDGTMREEVFRDVDGFFVFDSVVVQKQIVERQIMEARKNAMLKSQVRLLQIRRLELRDQANKLKSKNIAYRNVQKESKNIYKKMDLKTEKLSDDYKISQWFKDYIGTMRNREGAIDMAEEDLKNSISTLKNTIKDLKEKKEAVTEQCKQLEEENQRLSDEMERFRFERKQELIADHFEKQSKEVQNLKDSIAKMKALLERRKPRN